MAHPSARVVVGVDTHADTHTAAVVDELGRRQDEMRVATTPAGHRELLAWALQHGQIIAFGVEGSGSWGATLARYLTGQGHRVHEVPRPNRQERRRHGKSDVLDAEAAARAVLSGTTSVAKPGTGTAEMIRALRVARRSAASMRTDALNQMRGLVVNAPQELREQLRGQPVSTLVQRCVSFRPGRPETTTSATKLALRSLARRIAGLDAELTALDAELARLTTQAAPALVALPGVGPDLAGALLTVAGSDPTRVPSEAAFARLCGVAPLPASSGRTGRHRLNRGGDRQANNALWRIVICRIRARHRPTVAYLARRAAEGLSKREIIRCRSVGKVERLNLTLKHEWAYLAPYTSNQQRREASTATCTTTTATDPTARTEASHPWPCSPETRLREATTSPDGHSATTCQRPTSKMHRSAGSPLVAVTFVSLALLKPCGVPHLR